LFKANCYGCHGPSKQMNNLRLDRRRDAMPNRVGANGATIVPGNSAGSRLYLKLIGKAPGLQMPPTEPLSAEQINSVKTWIDQGAEWPDDVSGETPASTPDPKATRIMETLRSGDRAAFEKMLGADPKIANLKGPGGSTPLMYAALYGDADSIRVLLKNGAEPNAKNEVGATALMWAADDDAKTQLLLDGGANANARSDFGTTALIIAAGRFGSASVVKQLLDHGADPSAKSADSSPKTPLSVAALTGDPTVLRMLIDHGADVKSTASRALISAAVGPGCKGCIEMFAGSAGGNALNRACAIRAARGDAVTSRALLDLGADVNVADALGGGMTPLMLAATSDKVSVELLKTLIDRGADIRAKTANGETALDFAKRQGDTGAVDMLKKTGAEEGSQLSGQTPKPMPAASIRAAVERSIPLLQRSDGTFIQKAGCVSCHHNSLTAMAVAAARNAGVPVKEETAAKQLKTIAVYIDTWRERALQGIGIPGSQDTVSYILLGMAAENFPPDEATDAMARYLKSLQSSDGRWWISAVGRPPIESSDFEVTTASMRAIQVYAPKTRRAEYDESIRRAGSWLTEAQPTTNEDRAYQLLGMTWAGADKATIQRAARNLMAEQRTDGGWAQLPSLASDAYATGQALVALRECGALRISDPVYQRGTEFLLKTQLKDGSWYVKSRSVPLQPYFESDFPHGRDQWISAAATNWAVIALAPAAR
jgi:ankyrin repeat protein